MTVVDDLLQPSVLSHERSPAIYAGGLMVATALLAFAPRVGSISVSLGAGAAAGGALATAVCGVAWTGGVPNPLTLGEIAFDVADVGIAAGVVLLIGGALAHAWVHRRDLFEPV